MCSGLYVGSGGSGGAGVQYTGDEINIGVKRRIIIVQPTRAAAGVNLKREPDEFRLGYYLRWNNFRICHRTARQEETRALSRYIGAFTRIYNVYDSESDCDDDDDDYSDAAQKRVR